MNRRTWHYPRTQDANYILEGMSRGLLDRVTIFAPRKRGKTEFILKDVVPNALERNIFPVYVDFWANKSSPERVFTDSVLQAIQHYEGALGSIFKKANLSSVSFGKLVDVQLNHQSKETDTLGLAKIAFDQLNRLDTPVLLLLDEVQHLATKPEFSDFTAALRSFMTNRLVQNVKGIFTGSSRDGLVKLFSHTKAPFYSASAEIPFKRLDEDFVRHELAVFSDVSGKTLAFEPAYAVFETLFYEPGRFVDLLKKMVLEQVYDIQEGVKRFDNNVSQEKLNEFTRQYRKLGAFDKVLVQQLATSKLPHLFSPETYELLTAMTGKTVKRHTVNNAITRLSNKGILYSSSRGKYGFEEPAFKDYLASLDLQSS